MDITHNKALHTAPLPVTLIQPSRGWVPLNLHDLWEYRELLYFLVWRDVKVRYKQTVLGAAWAIIQPFCTMIVFSIFFGKLAKIPSDGIPYPLFSYAALVPWAYFANSLNQASNSLVGSGGLIQGKQYMLSLTWNAPQQAFDDPTDFFEAKGVDAVYFPFHKANQFLGMSALPTFLCVDVMKRPNIEGDVQRYEEHLKAVFNLPG